MFKVKLKISINMYPNIFGSEDIGRQLFHIKTAFYFVFPIINSKIV